MEMAYPSLYYYSVYENMYGVDATDFFPKRTDGTTMSFDDSFMIWRRQNSARHIRVDKIRLKLCNSPKLNYLNLLDYEDKRGDFHSSFFECISMYGFSYTFTKAFEDSEKYTSASIFYFYVKYLKNIPKDSIDLQAFNQKISHAAVNMVYCDSLLLQAIIDLYSATPSDKILLPVILKHLCTREVLIAYATEYIFTSCNASFFKELLDACISSRFSFWTTWERNSDLNTIPFCPVTYAYLFANLDLLKVLLDYGFCHTRQRDETLKIVLDEHPRASDLQWLENILFKDVQSPRSVLIDEVLLFISAFFYSSTDVSETLAKCFLLSWDARKEPYVTKRELLNPLKNHFGCLSRRREEYENMRLWFEERFDAFQTAIPDYQGLVPQPRSLKHLCRCTVREALNDNWEMPHGVAELPIPYAMKSYLLLR